MEIQGNTGNKTIKFLLYIYKINVLSSCFNNIQKSLKFLTVLKVIYSSVQHKI